MIFHLELPLNVLQNLIAANKVRITIVFVQPGCLFDRNRLESVTGQVRRYALSMQ